MSVGAKKKKLFRIYKEFAKDARKYTKNIVCKPGCADCCIDVGSIDVTTLEGLVILDYLKTLTPPKQTFFQDQIKRNSEEKPRHRRLRCPFLNERNICSIYKVRPFSCRKLFSVETCGEKGPVIPRALWELGEKTVQKIYQLDDSGFSGHISYILMLLYNHKLRKSYLSGGLSPSQLMDVIRKYNLIVNREMLKKQKILKLGTFRSTP